MHIFEDNWGQSGHFVTKNAFFLSLI
jgi:hypothetical protein